MQRKSPRVWKSLKVSSGSRRSCSASGARSRRAGSRLRTRSRYSAEVIMARLVAGATGSALPQGLLGAARRPLGLLERLGQGQQRLVGLVQVDGLAQRLTHLVGGRVVELDAVVLGIVEVHAAGDAVGHRAVDLHAGALKLVIENAYVLET